MERNLGFFEAWRAKRREKKNEELERLSAVKVEGGVLAKYLKLRNHEVEDGLKSFKERPPSSGTSREAVTNSSEVKEAVKDNAETVKEGFECRGKSSAVAAQDSPNGVNSLRSTQTGLPLPPQKNDTELSHAKRTNSSTSREGFTVRIPPLTYREKGAQASPKIGSGLKFETTKSGASTCSEKKSADENNEEKVIEKNLGKFEQVKATSEIGSVLAESSKSEQNETKERWKRSDAMENPIPGTPTETKKEKEREAKCGDAVGANKILDSASPKSEAEDAEAVGRGVNSPQEMVNAGTNVEHGRADASQKELDGKLQKRISEKTNVLKGRKTDRENNIKVDSPASRVKTGTPEIPENSVKFSAVESKTEATKSVVESSLKSESTKSVGETSPKKSPKKIPEGVRKATTKPDPSKTNSQKDLKRNSTAKLVTTPDVLPNKPKKVEADTRELEKEEKKSPSITKSSIPRSSHESLHREVAHEAVKLQEGMTLLIDSANKMGSDFPVKNNHDSNQVGQDTPTESPALRKDPKKLQKKLKTSSTPDERFPKTQKLLTNKPINPFEQAKLDQSKMESVVSPAKVEAFLRDALSPPTFIPTREPLKTMDAVVEEILTSTSDSSRHHNPSKLRFTSRGEVICGVVSIKPSAGEVDDGLSAISLLPTDRPETTPRTSDRLPEDSASQRSTEGVAPSAPAARDCFSPVSDFSDDSYDHYVASVDCSLDSYSRRALTGSSNPRRVFPQVAKATPYRSDRAKEESPVVFDAGLSFDIGSNRTSLRRRFQPQPAFTDMKTTSSSLSLRISDFLKRTDHIMEEWKRVGKGGDNLQDLVQVPSGTNSKSKSATNIMIRGLLNYSKGSGTRSMGSRSVAKTSEASDRTIADIDELSEMTLDLSEERATGTMQAERLEAETAERVRLEQELAQVQSEKKNLQQTTERLEMELFYARADVNGLSESEVDLEDGGGDATLYKNKCERAMRELEFTRRRLQQQHEDDLEQLVALKKQLEKKLSDAYEEVEEQRQVAAQWKRKVQKLQSETNDLRLLLEEQSSRNNLLEKKQRKFDSEIQLLQEELRSEKNQKERCSREKEMAVAEKYSLEQNLSSVRLELELKEEKVSALTRELEELTRGGGTEQEVTQLRKAKHDLEMKLKEQEEELDELAGQVTMLEGNKLRLEMSLESLRKEHRREMAQRDDELDEVRANGQKKIKVLESQLESEHEERTLLVREKHELERRLADAEERGRHHRAADEDALQRARRDLKKTKALLRDAQIMLERMKQDSPSKAALRALKNQLEDAELARASAVKAKQSLEAELNEATGQLEEALRAKADAENRCQTAIREMNSLRTQVDENEEELAELLKKYRQTVQQLSAEQLAGQETAGALAEAEAERAALREQLVELTAKLEANAVVDPMSDLAQKKLEIRIKELESRLELEQTTRGRLEVQIARLKENVERLNEECAQARTKEQAATDSTRKLQRSLREAKEELAAHQAKEQESAHKRKEMEKRLEAAEAEASTARTDLRLAVKRIEDLQSAISGEIGSDSERTESEEEDSENDSLVSHVPSTISSTSKTSRTPELAPR